MSTTDIPADADPSTARPPVAQLRPGALPPWEVFAQSVANIAPTASPTLVIPLVVLAAGAGAWVAYLFALVAIVLVAFNINQFARRSASPGNIYSFVNLGLGPVAAVTVGVGLLIAYVGTASAVTTGLANYVDVLLQEGFGLDGSQSPVVLSLIVGVAVIGAWAVAYKDVRLSTRLMLVIELTSVALILVVVVATFLTHDGPLVTPELLLSQTGFSGLRLGLVLAVFSFVGFESATSLGTEARRPLVTIPRAVLRSAVFVGVLFVVSAYAEVLGFTGKDTGLTESASPIQDLAGFAGLSWLALPITVAAIISFFACILASLTAGARVLFQLGRHGLAHDRLGAAHELNRTPHIALTVSALVALLPAAILTALGNNLFSIYGWVGTTATLAFIVTYVLVSIAAPVYLRRIGELRPVHVVVAVAAVVFQLVAFVGAVYPLPASPGQWPIAAFAILLLGGSGLVLWRSRGSRTLADEVAAHLASRRSEDAAAQVRS